MLSDEDNERLLENLAEYDVQSLMSRLRSNHYETEEDLKKFTDEELQQNLSATVHQVQALRKAYRLFTAAKSISSVRVSSRIQPSSKSSKKRRKLTASVAIGVFIKKTANNYVQWKATTFGKSTATMDISLAANKQELVKEVESTLNIKLINPMFIANFNCTKRVSLDAPAPVNQLISQLPTRPHRIYVFADSVSSDDASTSTSTQEPKPSESIPTSQSQPFELAEKVLHEPAATPVPALDEPAAAPVPAVHEAAAAPVPAVHEPAAAPVPTETAPVLMNLRPNREPSYNYRYRGEGSSTAHPMVYYALRSVTDDVGMCSFKETRRIDVYEKFIDLKLSNEMPHGFHGAHATCIGDLIFCCKPHMDEADSSFCVVRMFSLTAKEQKEFRRKLLSLINKVLPGKCVIVLFNRWSNDTDDMFIDLNNGTLLSAIVRFQDTEMVYYSQEETWYCRRGAVVTSVPESEVSAMVSRYGFLFVFQRTSEAEETRMTSQEQELDQTIDSVKDLFESQVIDAALMTEWKGAKVLWSDIAGYSDAKAVLQENFVLPHTRPEVYSGFYKSIVSSVLLYGPSGTGKSYMAQAIASSTGCRLFVVRPSDIMAKYVGEGEKLISCLFAIARKTKGSIVFFDECDGIMAKRGSESGASKISLKNQLLMEMQGQGDQMVVPVIATTNRRLALDPAFRSRFGIEHYVGLPNEDERCLLVESMLKKIETNPACHVSTKDIDIPVLVEDTEEMSNRDIVEMFKRAARSAVAEMVKQRANTITYKMNMFNKTV